LRSETRAVSIKEVAADVLVLPFYEGETPTEGRLEELDAATGGVVAALAEGGELRGKRDEVTYVHGPRGLSAGRVVLVGMGRRGADRDQERRAISVGVRHLRGKKHGVVAVVAKLFPPRRSTYPYIGRSNATISPSKSYWLRRRQTD
jgi:leucyl aminopeptidase